MVWINGDRYIGEFAMGLPHGAGVLVYGSGRVENVGDRYEAGLSGVSVMVPRVISGAMGKLG